MIFFSLGKPKPFGLCSVVMVVIMFVDSQMVVRHPPASRLQLYIRELVFVSEVEEVSSSYKLTCKLGMSKLMH